MLRHALGIALWAVGLSILLGAVIVAAAAAGASPSAAVVLAGGTVTAAAFAPLVRRSGRTVAVIQRRSATVVLALVLSLVGYLSPHPADAPSAASGLRLPDGNVLAVQRYGQGGVWVNGPLVVVHGGPGVPMTPHEQATLTAALPERQVVFYDQLGAGRSSRLKQPSGYTMERAVADLAAVVDSLGAPTVTVLGYSWGAPVATLYAASHPGRVERLVLLSPGALPLSGVATPPAQPQARLGTGDTVRLYARSLEPRNLFVYLLTLANIDTAHRFAGDAEMDERFLALYEVAARGTNCATVPVRSLPSRLGYYASQNPQLVPSPTLDDTARVVLARLPALVVRGSCDYIPRTAAQSYLHVLPRARLEHLPDAGHAVLDDRPGAVTGLVSRFLRSPE